MPRAWYSYITGSPFTAVNWRLISGPPACVNGSEPCAIYVAYTGDTPPTFAPPPLSPNIQGYLATARATLVAEPQGDFKRFVYLRFTS